jgi:hypothetical protein
VERERETQRERHTKGQREWKRERQREKKNEGRGIETLRKISCKIYIAYF